MLVFSCLCISTGSEFSVSLFLLFKGKTTSTVFLNIVEISIDLLLVLTGDALEEISMEANSRMKNFVFILNDL